MLFMNAATFAELRADDLRREAEWVRLGRGASGSPTFGPMARLIHRGRPTRTRSLGARPGSGALARHGLGVPDAA
jgi:hypothetical protein